MCTMLNKIWFSNDVLLLLLHLHISIFIEVQPLKGPAISTDNDMCE